MSSTLKVAAVQMCSGPDVDQNLRMAERLLEQAARQGADWAVLPENFSALDAPSAVLRSSAQAIVDWMSRQARQLGMGVVGGSIALPWRPDGQPVERGRFRSACLVMDEQGRITGRYDKIHLFDAQVQDGRGGYNESSLYEPGDAPIQMNMDGWCLQPIICYDLRFPEILRSGHLPPDWVSLPAAFTAVTGARHWSLLVRTRAVENQCYVVAANQGGHHPGGRETWGHSMIVSPDGDVLAEQVNADAHGGVIVAELSLDRIRSVRTAMPLWQHRRIGVAAQKSE